MREVGVIRYLLDEIENEEKYNFEYDYERGKAERRAGVEDDNIYYYYKYMPEKFNREPRQSVIKANAKKIRQLALKLY